MFLLRHAYHCLGLKKYEEVCSTCSYDFSGSCKACRYLQVSWFSHVCWTFTQISRNDKKAVELVQHQGSLELEQAGDQPWAASGLPAASFPFSQINNHCGTLMASPSKLGLGDPWKSEVQLLMQALLHSCCCLSHTDLPPHTHSI